MDLGFSTEQEMLRDTAAKFFAAECPSEKVREIEESEQGYSSELWQKMAELGWMGVFFPEEYGGYGGQFIDLVIILEELGAAAYPSPFYSTVIQSGFTILEGGSEDQKKDLLAKISEGSIIMSLAQYEEEGSYRATGINMPAKSSGDGYVLNGTKMFVSDANIADKLIVAAKADEGITLFLVDAKASGITTTKMPTIGMDNTCEVIFKDVKVSKGDIIGAPGKGWDILEKMFDRAVVAKCAEMVGGSKRSIDITAEYAKERVQYGKPIGGYQAIQHYMANMLLGYDTSFNYLHKVTWMIDEGMDCGKEASALKAQVNEQYKFITERGVQIHGGVGTTREFDIGLYYRRAKSCEYVSGDTDFHYERVAVGLGM